MQDGRIKRVHLEYCLIFFITAILSVLGLIKAMVYSSATLIILNLIVALLIVVFYVYCGWNRFIKDYVFDKCNVAEYERFLLSRNTKNVHVKTMLDKMSFLTRIVPTEKSDYVDDFIRIEEEILLGKSIDATDKDIMEKMSKDKNIGISRYYGILEDINAEKYEDALLMLDSIERKSNFSDIPRQFYYAYIFKKLDCHNYEYKASAAFVLNRGRDTRYGKYAKQIFKTDVVSELKAEKQDIPGFILGFLVFLIWIGVLFLAV